MTLEELIKKKLHELVTPATGCTEPVAIALACARSAAELNGEIEKIEIEMSKSFYKNAIAVGIPNTDEKGIHIAAGLGAIAGDHSLLLRVLEKTTPADLFEAKKMTTAGKIIATYIDAPNEVYVKATVKSGDDEVTTIIIGDHANIESVERNGEIIFSQKTNEKQEKQETEIKLGNYFIKDIIKEVQKLEMEDLEFLKEGIQMNRAISQYGWENSPCLGIGFGLNKLMQKGRMCNNIINRIRMAVAAGSDARMGGVNMPVMTSAGSGNQGIIVFLSVDLFAEHLKIDELTKLRALALAHIINGYVKEFMLKLSPICGATVSAGLGVSCAITWLLGGTHEQIVGAMNGMLASLTGMMCDGAKGSCAYKLLTAAGEAVTQAYLALEGVYIRDQQGVIETTLENSIQNIGKIGQEGMCNVNNVMLEIIANRMN